MSSGQASTAGAMPKLLSRFQKRNWPGSMTRNRSAPAPWRRNWASKPCPNLKAALEAAQAVSIVIPTTEHAPVARQALERGVDVLVEKPITATIEEAKSLIQVAERAGRILQVGHLERFNPGVVAAKAVTKQPLFFEIHRLGVFSPRSLDVDVVFDLMIHDLDLVLWMVGAEVRDVRAVGLPVLSNKVDIANARVEFENGAVANLTASRVSTEKSPEVPLFPTPRIHLHRLLPA